MYGRGSVEQKRVPAFVVRERRARRLRIFRILTAILLVGLIALFFALFPYRLFLSPLDIPARGAGETRLHFLSVGEGDATVIETDEGCLVVDAGAGGFRETNHILRYLKGLHPARLSYLVTYAARDHCGGMADLIDVLGADEVYLAPLPSKDGPYQAFCRAAERSGAEVSTLWRGDGFSFGSAHIYCVSPPLDGERDKNDASCVLYLEADGVRALLGTDISSSREREIMDAYGYGVFGEEAELFGLDILRVSHHGSAYSSSEEWLDFLSPRVAVISCGAGNIYGHPAAETVKRLTSRGVSVYRTDELGDIMITIGENSFHVRSDGTE